MAKPVDANFQMAPSAALIKRYNEFNFTNLYLYHIGLGPNKNQVGVVNRDSETGLGSIVVNNWQICDGLGPDAKVVARAQGMHIYAGKWHCSLSIVFENEKFKGSTLEVSGVVVEEGEWAIVGGTGQFQMATGVIYKKMAKEIAGQGNVIELTISGLCPVVVKPYKAGPWGSNSEGSPFDVKQTPVGLVESITVRHGDVVDRLQYYYVDQAGGKHYEQVGGTGGNSSTIKLAPDEHVVEVSGTIGKWDTEVAVASIKFVTNKGSYGPYGLGLNPSSSFSARAEDGYKIAGFFGRSGRCVNALGFYMHPL